MPLRGKITDEAGDLSDRLRIARMQHRNRMPGDGNAVLTDASGEDVLLAVRHVDQVCQAER